MGEISHITEKKNLQKKNLLAVKASVWAAPSNFCRLPNVSQTGKTFYCNPGYLFLRKHSDVFHGGALKGRACCFPGTLDSLLRPVTATLLLPVVMRIFCIF